MSDDAIMVTRGWADPYWQQCQICNGGTCGIFGGGQDTGYCGLRSCNKCNIIGCQLCVPAVYIGQILEQYPPRFPEKRFPDIVYKCKSCIDLESSLM